MYGYDDKVECSNDVAGLFGASRCGCGLMS